MRAMPVSRSAASVHLDAIRGLAALVVFLAHARNMFFGSPGSAASTSERATATAALGIGHHAVIVFFVLSGYLVGSSVARAVSAGRWSARGYATQRLSRLWTVLLPALVIGAVLDLSGMRLFGHGTLYFAPPGQAVILVPVPQMSGMLTLALNAVFLQTIAAPTFGTNVALWSLANEFWYYVAFPLTVVALLPGTRMPVRIAVIVALAVVGLLVGASIAAYFTIWLFGVGLSFAPRPEVRAPLLWIGTAAFALLSTSAFVRTHPLPPFAADVWLGVACSLLVYTCLLERRRSSGGLYARASHGLSSISYTLYLVHLPALVFINAAVLGQWHPWPKDVAHLAGFVGVVAGIFAYGCVMYLLFERHTDQIRRALDASRTAG